MLRVPALVLAALLPATALADDPPAEGAEEGAAEEGAVEEEAAPSPVNYRVDGKQGMTYIVVNKDPSTLAAGLSHDHAIRAKGLSGSFTWNAADPGACRLKVLLPVNQLDVDAPATRAAAGIEGTLSDGQREDVKKNMLAKGQLYASNFPTITFQSDGCSLDGDAFAVQGDLTIRGKAKRVILRGSLRADNDAFRLQGSVQIKATDFGFEPYTALLGQLKNKNEMKLVIDLQGSAG